MIHPDAARCLMCKRARCVDNCAVHTDIPTVMKLYKEGKIEEAAQILFNNNPLSGITCQVCDWKKMCFGHCVLNVKNAPVHWYQIEQEISMEYLKTVEIEVGEPVGKSVGIIGAGPAGIAAAIFLRKRGFEVTIYDKHRRIGGVLRYGIPEFRLDDKFIGYYERIINNAGIHFRPKVKIGKVMTLNQIRNAHDAVLLAAGADKPRRLRIPGEDNPHVIPALSYLDEPGYYELGKKIIVVGGGNVAMDACRTAARFGHETYLYYRKSFENMPANTTEVEEAKADGVQFMLMQTPVEIKIVDGRNIAVIRDCQTVFNPDGTIATKILDGTDHEVEFDDMILAVSETVDFSIFGENPPEMDSKGWPVVNGMQQTSFPDLFLAGDFLLGPKTVVAAVQSAKVACQGIREYLK